MDCSPLPRVNGIGDAYTAKCVEPSNLKENPSYQDEDKREADTLTSNNLP